VPLEYTYSCHTGRTWLARWLGDVKSWRIQVTMVCSLEHWPTSSSGPPRCGRRKFVETRKLFAWRRKQGLPFTSPKEYPGLLGPEETNGKECHHQHHRFFLEGEWLSFSQKARWKAWTCMNAGMNYRKQNPTTEPPMQFAIWFASKRKKQEKTFKAQIKISFSVQQ